jgi:hypothetical protein
MGQQDFSGQKTRKRKMKKTSAPLPCGYHMHAYEWHGRHTLLEEE